MGGHHLDAPVVGIAATPDGRGYWLVAADGGVFNFGDAAFSGSMGGEHLNAPVVGIAASGGGGYWLVASDGGVFNFGNAGFFGSTGGQRLNAPVAGIAATPDGGGYWLAGSDGGLRLRERGVLRLRAGTGHRGSAPGRRDQSHAHRSGLLAGGVEWCCLRLRGRGVPRLAERIQAERPRVGHRVVGGRYPACRPQTKSEPPSTLTQAPVT